MTGPWYSLGTREGAGEGADETILGAVSNRSYRRRWRSGSLLERWRRMGGVINVFLEDPRFDYRFKTPAKPDYRVRLKLNKQKAKRA